MKLCLVFPGIGYHSDKPLIYYSKKIAKENNYSIIEIHYKGFEGDILNHKDDRQNAIQLGISQADQVLKSIDFSDYDEILALAKSIGTTIALACMDKMDIKGKAVLYTPIEETFAYNVSNAVIFHGMNDPWLDNNTYSEQIEKQNWIHYEYDQCNHSMETNHAIMDLTICKDIMTKTQKFIEGEDGV